VGNAAENGLHFAGMLGSGLPFATGVCKAAKFFMMQLRRQELMKIAGDAGV
jgi:hypothetical protein